MGQLLCRTILSWVSQSFIHYYYPTLTLISLPLHISNKVESMIKEQHLTYPQDPI